MATWSPKTGSLDDIFIGRATGTGTSSSDKGRNSAVEKANNISNGNNVTRLSNLLMNYSSNRSIVGSDATKYVNDGGKIVFKIVQSGSFYYAFGLPSPDSKWESAYYIASTTKQLKQLISDPSRNDHPKTCLYENQSEHNATIVYKNNTYYLKVKCTTDPEGAQWSGNEDAYCSTMYIPLDGDSWLASHNSKVVQFTAISEGGLLQRTSNGGNPDKGQYSDDSNESSNEVPFEAANDEYADGFTSEHYQTEHEYFEDLYWMDPNEYSLKSFHSIVGIPVQFMGNVDARMGASTFGKQFSEDILYDAPICVIHPGTPCIETSDDENGDYNKLLKSVLKAYVNVGNVVFGNDETKKETIENLVAQTLAGKYNRYYGFQSEYNRYVQYVNTLCHLFTHFLGIDQKIMPGTNKKYGNYDDTIKDVEFADNGLSMRMRYGSYPAVYLYYQPDSSLTHTLQNTTTESSFASKLNEVSNYSKELLFLAGAVGANERNASNVGTDVNAGPLYNLSTLGSGKGILSRVFSRTAEGVGTIVGGNNLSLPEIYSDSRTDSSQQELHIKLVNPYGTPEGAFLFQLRGLARIMAMSYPRQYGPNGYTSPFIIRAFSKGQFNIQLGIVESVMIRRAGSGGENQTVHGIPMELDVTVSIKDMYQQFAISNEYIGLNKGFQLTMNNIGLLDFMASFAGYNLSQPEVAVKMDYAIDRMINKINDVIQIPGVFGNQEWKSPMWNRKCMDAFKDAVEVQSTFGIRT